MDGQEKKESSGPGMLARAARLAKRSVRLIMLLVLRLTILLALLATLTLGACYWYSGTEQGQRRLTGLVNSLLESALSPRGLRVSIAALGGRPPFALQALGLRLEDARGLCLEAEEAALGVSLSVSNLQARRLVLETLSLRGVRLTRLPRILPPGPPEFPESRPGEPERTPRQSLDPERLFALWPDFLHSAALPSVTLEHMALHPDIAAMAGLNLESDLVFSLQGKAQADADACSLALTVERLDIPASDSLTLTLAVSRRGDSSLELSLAEDTSGLLFSFLPQDRVRALANALGAGRTQAGEPHAFPPLPPLTMMAMTLSLNAAGRLPALEGDLRLSLRDGEHAPAALFDFRSAFSLTPAPYAWDAAVRDLRAEGGGLRLSAPLLEIRDPLALAAPSAQTGIARAAGLPSLLAHLEPKGGVKLEILDWTALAALIGQEVHADGLSLSLDLDLPRALSAELKTDALLGPDLAIESLAATLNARMDDKLTLEALSSALTVGEYGLAKAEIRAGLDLDGAWALSPPNALTDVLTYDPRDDRAGTLPGTLPGTLADALAGTLTAELSAEALRGPGMSLDALGATLSAVLDGEAQARDLAASVTAGPLHIAGITLKDMKGDISGGLPQGIQLSLSNGGDLRGAVKGVWKPGEIALDALDLHARFDGRAMALLPESSKEGEELGIRLVRPARLSYAPSAFSASGLELDLLPSGRVLVNGALSGQGYDLAASLSRVDLAPFRFLLSALPDGRAEAEISLRGSPARPDGDLSLTLNQVHMPGTPFAPVNLSLEGSLSHRGGGSLQAALRFDPDSLRALGLTRAEADLALPLDFAAPAPDADQASAHASAHASGHASAHASGQLAGLPLPSRTRPVEASLTLQGDLADIGRLLPLGDRRLRGQADVRADLGGTLNEPGLKLDAVLNGAAYEDLVLGVLLTDINAKAAMSPGGDIALDLRAGDGLGGSLALTGALRTDGMRFELNGSMDNLRPLRRQDLRVSLSGTAQGSGTVSAPDLKADIRVNEGSLQLAHLPGSGLRTLDIAQDGEGAAPRPSDAPSTQSAQSGERQDTEQAGGSLDLTLSVPTRFFVRGYGLDSEWRGRVRARGPLARPELVGRLEAVRGAMDFLNRNFSLNHGAVILDGGWPANPRLDIVLDYQAANIVAGIQVNGTARQPKLELVSEPHLPQDEILSQILFGKSVSAIGKLEALQLASAVAGLAGGGGGGGLLGLGRQALGVDVLRLNTGNGGEGDEDMQSSSLEMGKYIHDRVYVGVQQGMGPESSGGVVEIELTPRIHFKAGTRGGDSEAGLRWQRNY